MDENGTLRTSTLTDYETQEHNQTILVRATDEWNATLEKQFIVQISDVFEDLDQDGIEDHNDSDMDGDGVANLDEYSWGSDPSDANDVNHRPSNITLSGLHLHCREFIDWIYGRTIQRGRCRWE